MAHMDSAASQRDGMEYQRAMLAVCETTKRYFEASLATPQDEMEQLEIDVLNALVQWDDERSV